MKKLLFLVIILIPFSSVSSQNEMMVEEGEIKFFLKNKIKKFVQNTGSEEKAIGKLIEYSLPDTFFNEKNRDLIWQTNSTQKIIDMDYYASIKLQSFYWILKIYHSDYNSHKDEYCQFLDMDGQPIWDYKDVDISLKAYYYQVILASPVEHMKYYNELGYTRNDSESYEYLSDCFKVWYDEMKEKGLDYMRKNNISPIKSSNYVIKL